MAEAKQEQLDVVLTESKDEILYVTQVDVLLVFSSCVTYDGLGQLLYLGVLSVVSIFENLLEQI